MKYESFSVGNKIRIIKGFKLGASGFIIENGNIAEVIEIPENLLLLKAKVAGVEFYIHKDRVEKI